MLLYGFSGTMLTSSNSGKFGWILLGSTGTVAVVFFLAVSFLIGALTTGGIAVEGFTVGSLGIDPFVVGLIVFEIFVAVMLFRSGLSGNVAFVTGTFRALSTAAYVDGASEAVGTCDRGKAIFSSVVTVGSVGFVDLLSAGTFPSDCRRSLLQQHGLYNYMPVLREHRHIICQLFIREYMFAYDWHILIYATVREHVFASI